VKSPPGRTAAAWNGDLDSRMIHHLLLTIISGRLSTRLATEAEVDVGNVL
jgi:hypothetical protein